VRIVQVDSLLTGGGTDDQVLKLASSLHRLGQPCWLAGPEKRECSKAIQAAGIPFHPMLPGASAGIDFIRALAQFIRREKIQIVHAHHGRDFWPTILAARLSMARPKIVLTRHLAKSPGSWVSRNFLLSQCDACIAVSNFVAKVMRDGVHEPDATDPERQSRPPLRGDHRKIHVIHGGIDTDRFRPSDATEQRRRWGLAPEHYAFAVVGAYHLPRGKGQREFLEAAARIHEKIPHARFLIIGRGDLSKLLLADIARLGLAEKAQLTPYATDMPTVMNAIDCLVHPASGTEAFGLVACEAQACGKPVIASALDGIPEAFAAASYGRLVPSGDIVGLAGAMATQARQTKLSLTEAEQMHDKVEENFSLTQMGDKVLRLYRDLLGANSSK
jgi:glycosyltransferase involved in cell wall biosynthesis